MHRNLILFFVSNAYCRGAKINKIKVEKFYIYAIMHTMSMQKQNKLKYLWKLWPSHTALPISFLKEKGFTKSLIQKYVSSGWMTYLDRGVVIRPDDRIDWPGILWGVQQSSAFHIGGKTALELQGKSHYIRFRETTVFLFSDHSLKLPFWLKKETLVPQFIHVKTNFLPNTVGLSEHDFGEFSLKISNPARAFLEYMYLLKKTDAYDEAYYLMENLGFVSPALFQEVLEACHSIKIKRLVLCLAKKVQVQWLGALDFSRIDLGKGPREAVLGGKYDPEYQITYPRDWDKDEDEVIF